MIDYKRMWWNLEEEVEKEAEERYFYFIDTLLANMESSEQFEADGKVLPVHKLHRSFNCDYGVAWTLLKRHLEELRKEDDYIEIEELCTTMNDIENSLIRW